MAHVPPPRLNKFIKREHYRHFQIEYYRDAEGGFFSLMLYRGNSWVPTGQAYPKHHRVLMDRENKDDLGQLMIDTRSYLDQVAEWQKENNTPTT